MFTVSGKKPRLKNLINPFYLRDGFSNYVLSGLIYKLTPGTDIFTQDWKFLIILDACRPDIFLKVTKKLKLKGNFKTILSKGPTTGSFVKNSIGNRKMKDVVYINANPSVNKILDELTPKNFHAFYNLWLTHWDDNLKTVHPKHVIKETLKIIPKHKNKRFIIHFLQPHMPFLTLKRFRKLSMIAKFKRHFLYHSGLFTVCGDPLYPFMTKNQIIYHYTKSLEITLSLIKSKLLPKLKKLGKVVITSDHSELFGERFLFFKIYGHVDVPSPKLRRVPWFEVI